MLDVGAGMKRKSFQRTVSALLMHQSDQHPHPYLNIPLDERSCG